MSITLKKETIHRLLKDVKDIIKNPLTDNGIYYTHDDEDILKGYALIIGPSDTPYYAGNFFFEFKFPPDYPHSPPLVSYKTNDEMIRFNPNLYTCGKVCVSLLNTWRGEQWTSCQSISSVLLTLCTLLCKNPLLNEPGVSLNHPDFENYTKIIEYKTIDIAVLKIVQKMPCVYQGNFLCFYPFVKENFLKNSENLEKFLREMAEKEAVQNLRTSMYQMRIHIDYPNLLKKFMSVLDLIKSEN
uniref:Ubiquitin-conjugating enzyme E2 Z n=1 Tax=viral metagenome TaxID=1070528 RepID=A0A6C0KYN0_9ZZZZ